MNITLQPVAASDYQSWLEAKIAFFSDEAQFYAATPNQESLRANFSNRLLEDYRRSLAMVYEYQAEMASATAPACAAGAESTARR